MAKIIGGVPHSGLTPPMWEILDFLVFHPLEVTEPLNFLKLWGKKLRVHWLVTRSLQPFQLRYSLYRLDIVFNKLYK